MFKTDCPMCGASSDNARLEVVSGEFACSGMRLEPDGFAFMDAHSVDTSEERVRCAACSRVFSLQLCFDDEE